MSDNPYIIAGNALEGTSCVDYNVSSAIVDALYDAGLLYMGTRIIRTVAELEALDPDTVVWPARHYGPYAVGTLTPDPLDPYWTPPLPAVVIRDGADVRAALRELEEA